MSQTFLCLIRHIDYKNTKMQGIDQINKGLSFAIEMRCRVRTDSLQSTRYTNSTKYQCDNQREGRKQEKERKGEGEKGKGEVERYSANFR